MSDFVNAILPAANRSDPDVIGIDRGISVVMTENLRGGPVWKSHSCDLECARAMELTDFKMTIK
jgi:hypothetical protein